MPEQCFPVNTHLHSVAAPHLLFAFQNKPCLNISTFQLIKLLPYISPYIGKNYYFFHVSELGGSFLHTR